MSTAHTAKGPWQRLVARCNRFADDDFDGSSGNAGRLRHKLRVTVAGVAFSLLMLEILLTRMYPFFLGDISAFFAIPVAMFGLSLGALALHWIRGEAQLRWIPLLLPVLLAVTLLSLLTFFGLFNHVFNLAHHWGQNPWHDAPKTAVLSLLFVPVFSIGGVILATAFAASARTIGRLYALDLFGSALACLAAPLLLQLLDLPLVICVLLAVLSLCWATVWSARRRLLALVLVGCFVVLAPLAGLQLVFTEQPDASVLAKKYAKNRDAREVRHRWNAISRVALVQLLDHGKPAGWRLIHDDGISNVYLRRYRMKRVHNPPDDVTPQRIPSLMDRTPESALVMFAGCGKDMVAMNEYAGGELQITGIELNPLVPRLVTAWWWDGWNLRAFYDQPGIDLRTEEGRSFLNRDRRKFDAIFVATNGAQHATRTGHSRKYLDTHEAMEAYLEHLSDDGVIVFNFQPFRQKMEVFKRLFAQRDGPPFSQTVMILNAKNRKVKGDGLRPPLIAVVKPSGFSASEVTRVKQMWEGGENKYVYYAPGFEPYRKLAKKVHAPIDPEAFVPTDDQPYAKRVELENFQLFPKPAKLNGETYALSWIKIFTTILFGGLALLTIGAFYLRGRGASNRPRRLPLWLTAYFLLTGICYMFVQIGLIAKLELFLGNPVFAVSVVLAAYLMSNGLGSAWIGRRQAAGNLPPLAVVALLACGATLATMGLVELGIQTLLGWPLALKIPLTVLGLFPLGFVLGMFYPVGVTLTLQHAQPSLVPKTFGLATLSSVLGSTWAIVAVINQGFRMIIEQAALGYAVLVVCAALPLVVIRLRGKP